MIKITEKSTTTPYNNKGFTLAETLITLVIIGVVAALTIPNMIVNHQKEETLTRLKKAYSTLAQTTNKAIADNGPISSWEIERFQTKEFAEKYMIPYLSIIKDCGYETTGDCSFEKANLNTPNNKSGYSNEFYRLILADGTALIFRAVTGSRTTGGETFRYSRVYIYIDINGKKNPNVLGKDVFYYSYFIFLTNPVLSGLVPYGCEGKPQNSRNGLKERCKKDSDGSYCAGLIWKDGWTIADDYPW